LRRLFGDLTGQITDEDHLRKLWSDPDSREILLIQLSERGYDNDRLSDIRNLVDAPDSDLLDVLGYVLYTNASKTREDRAETVKGDSLKAEQGDLKDLLICILDAYQKNGEASWRPGNWFRP
jgi:type I restriction enzyme R subunit